MHGERSERRLFLINKGQSAATVDLEAPGFRGRSHRMSPFDPTGAGRTLDATDVRIDGQAIAADGTWPGLHPTACRHTAGTPRSRSGPRKRSS